MHRRQLFIILAVFCSLLFTLAAHAQIPQTATGLVYLSSAQNQDGTWGNGTSTVETTAATLSVLETLKLLDQTAGTPYTSGTAWLQGQAPQTVATIADRIRILNLTDGSVNTLIPLLDTLTRAWGGAGGYLTNPLDTALALKALRAANYPDLTVSNNALAYLTNSQNADGGWGFALGDPSAGSGQADSNLFVTAIVSATLQQFPQTTFIATAITKASAYLAIWQNADGGFGVSPSGQEASTIFETALVYSALIGDGQTPAQPLQRAVNYLTANQSLNGSWNDDPYATALALKALYLSENKPAPPPPAATTGSVMGSVRNGATNAPLAGVTARLANNPAVSVSSDATGLFALSGIPVGSQQITLTAAGFAPLTVTADISAGTFINLGAINLSTSPTSGTVMGIIWDADANAPYAGVTVQAIVNNNISYSYQTTSAGDGSFRLNDVPAGFVTVGTPAGPKTGYWNVPMTGTLAPGGILLYNPRMSTTHPPIASLSARTDKALYRKGDTVSLTIDIQNKRSIDYPATLQLQVTDPSGTSVYTTSINVNLTAKALLSQNAAFTLPANAKGGFYSVQVELADTGGEKLATTVSFGLLMSQIAVTPNLPTQFVQGANTLTFDLANRGSTSVTAGELAVTLTGPDGVPVSIAYRSFSLSRGEITALSYTLTLPQLKFGAYTLSYTQSDETTSGQAVVIPLQNSITIAPTLDKATYRDGDTANLVLQLTNSGRFTLESAVVAVTAPAAGFSDTRNITLAQGQAQTLLFAIPLPATITSGDQTVTVTVTLPGGAAVTGSAAITIPPSLLAFSFPQSDFTAGAVISAAIANSGGVATQAQYRLSLYDAKSALIAETSQSGTVAANGTLAVSLPIPAGATAGGYVLTAAFSDLTTGKTESVQQNLTITGVKGSLTVQTGKQTYLSTESVTALSSISNSGTVLQGGNLHLQVSSSGVQVKKSWTSQYDFQQGVRNGVDTYSLADSVTLTSFSDTFDAGFLNIDRWQPVASPAGGPPPTVDNGRLLIEMPNPGSWPASMADLIAPVSGDFDTQVDYQVASANSADGSKHPAGLSVHRQGYYLGVDLWGGGAGGTYGTCDSSTCNNAGGGQPTGKFRIRRIGSSYSSFYWNGTGWSTILTSYNKPAGPIYIRLMVNGTNGQVKTYFDNFSVSTQTYPSSGTLNLKYDAGRSEVWDKLAFNSDIPAGTSIKFRTRSAETETGLTSAVWSSYLTTSGSPITSPKGRWIEAEATLSTTNTAATPMLHDLTITQGQNPGEALWQTDVPVNLAPGELIDLNKVIGAISTAGKYYLQGKLTTPTGQSVATAEYPFYVVPGNTVLNFSTDKKTYKPGETVTISGTVTNLGTTVASNLAFVLKSKIAGGTEQLLTSETYSLAAGGSHPFTVTTTAGTQGTFSLTAAVSQGTAALTQVADTYEVASPNVTALLNAPSSAGDTPFSLTLTLANSGKSMAIITIAKSFASPAETITVPAGERKVLQYQQQIAADTTYLFTLTGDLSQQLTKTVVYTVPQQSVKVTARAVTDKVSYQANEQVLLATIVTCQVPGTVGDSMATTLLITDSNGAVHFAQRTLLADPYAGRIYTVKKAWNSTGYPAGVYTARVVVEEGGAQLASGEATFTLLPSTATAAGVVGTLTPALNPLYRGLNQTLAFTLSNNGNEGLAGATVSVMVIDPASEAVRQTDTRLIDLPRQGTYAATVNVPTASLAAGDYLAVLQISLPGMPQPKTLAGAPLSVRIAPPPTLLLSTLADGAVTNNQTLNIAGSVTGVVAIKSLTINGVDVPLNSDGSFSNAMLLQSGSNQFVITATDILDHSSSDVRTISLDQTAPLLAITAPADNSKTAAPLIDVTGTVDEAATVQVKLGDNVQSAAMNGTSFAATVALAPGSNTIEVTATDLAGNPGSQKRSVVHDDQKPSLAITEPPQDSRTNQSSLTVSGSVSDPYTAVGVTVAMDGTIMTPAVIGGIFSQVVTFTGEKLYPITVTATNEVGTQATAQRNVIFDRTPPTLTIDPAVSPTNAAGQIVSGTREEGTTVTVSCATATFGAVEYPTTTSWRAPLAGLQQGENLVQTATTDQAGNRTTASTTILYVPKAPEVTISATPNQLWSPNKKLVPVVIDGNVVTFGSDIKDVTIFVVDEYGTYNLHGLKFGDTIMLEAWREGTDKDDRIYTITAVVTDQAGNTTTRSTTVVVPHDVSK